MSHHYSVEWIEGRKISLEASEDLTKGQVVKVSGGKAAVAGAGDVPIGVVVATVSQNKQATILVSGVAKVTAGGAITAGAAVKATTNGKVVAVDWAGGDTADLVLGIALTAASGDGDKILVLLK